MNLLLVLTHPIGRGGRNVISIQVNKLTTGTGVLAVWRVQIIETPNQEKLHSYLNPGVLRHALL